MKLAAFALSASMVLAQAQSDTLPSVTAVRTWPSAGATRVAIEVTGPFEYKYDRLQNPDRVYFDIKGAKPRIEGKRAWSRLVTDPLVQRIRVAETVPGVTRVVVELSGPVEVAPSQLTSPYRLMVELRSKTPAVITESAPAPAPSVIPESALTKPEVPLAKPEVPKVAETLPEAVRPEPTRRETARTSPPPALPVKAPPVKTETTAPVVVEAAPEAAPAAPPKDAPVSPAESAKAARRTSSGGSSLTRALGLKLNRIVLDAGHGGHDQGTSGAKGLQEKELVLDVTLRLGKLIEQGLGAEVIYTRNDDTFIPLEGRTAIANEKKADLFLSIHANSSPYPRITGVETYYLNFTDSKEAMDLATRENAASQRSIFELQDLLHKITLHEKIDESREFAARMQAALFALSSRSFPGQKNRGVKKAPFVVLIGAQMPSILAEIGFVTNPREEQLLKRPDYRQKIAESLYKGLSKYAESLSHFQLAQNQ